MYGKNISFIFFLLFLAACTSTNNNADVPLPAYWPTDGWRIDSPANHGFDETVLAGIDEYVLTEVPYLDSLLIIRDGYIVFESYYNDYDLDALHDIASVTKSWTSALVGIALEEGAIENLDDTLSDLLPDYEIAQNYADKSDITLRDLLMMRSGIEWDEVTFDTGGYGTPEELLELDTVAFGLTFPMAYEPGQAWNYSSLDSQLISAVVQEAVGEPLSQYIIPSLFEPMGVDKFEWLEVSGVTVGGQQMSVTPRDMAKLGLLYLHNGMWDGEQLVPAEWVEQSLTAQGDEALYVPMGENLEIEFYGYHWWIWKPDWHYGYRSFAANGYGGQVLLVLPEINLIFVTTANLQGIDPDTSDEQAEQIGEFIVNMLIPSLTDVELDYDIHIER